MPAKAEMPTMVDTHDLHFSCFDRLPPIWTEWHESDLEGIDVETLLEARAELKQLMRALDFMLGERCN